MTRTKLRARSWIALIVIVALAVPAMSNTRREWASAETQAQHVATIIDASYGLCGMLVLPTRWNPS